MKIAMLTPYLPYPPDTGGKIRSYYLLKALSSKHEVDLISVYYEREPEGVEQVRRICSSVSLFRLSRPWTRSDRLKRIMAPMPLSVDHFYMPEAAIEVNKVLERGNYNLIYVDELCMTSYTTGIDDIPQILGRQKIDYVHYQEVAAARGWGRQKLLDLLECHKLKHYERKTLNENYYARCIVCSERDKETLLVLNPTLRIVVIPNGADTAYFRPQPPPADNAPTLIFTGTMFYYPNIDAVLYFFDRIYPHIVAGVPDVRVLIVGHNPAPEIKGLERFSNVRVTGYVPDIRPYIAQSTAMIVPLRLGGGTRLKILEAMAMERPVISTSIGAEGLAVQAGEGIMIADDPLNFASKTVELLQSPELRHRIVARARRLVENSYSWDVLGKRFLEACQEAVHQQ